MSGLETEAPPVGEEVHMPEPSMLPIVNAVGVSLSIVGLTLVIWIRSAAHDISELPLDHSSH